MPSKALSTVVREVDDMVFSAADVEHAKARLMRLVDAKIVVRSDRRDEFGRIMYEERDDSAIQLAAAVRVIEFGRGKARQMVEVTTSKHGQKGVTPQDLIQMALGNPSLARAIVEGVVGAAKTVDAEEAEVSEVPETGQNGALSESESESRQRESPSS